MSALSAIMIPKPADEQAFERACAVLWRGLLKDPGVQRNGRRGQSQRGVDLYGYRDRDPEQLVGIQCKLKGPGRELTEAEVRHEVGLALTFTPPLQEYFIVTTAPDDEEMQALARLLTAEQNQTGRRIAISVWGWNTLEERIADDADAWKAFDPSYTPFAEKLSSEVEAVRLQQIQIGAASTAQQDRIVLEIQALRASVTGSVSDTTSLSAFETELDASIDTYRSILTDDGEAATAHSLLTKLLHRVEGSASGRILFRIKANIGACLIAQGDDEGGAQRLLEAFQHAPDEPKAIANKALALLIQQKPNEALEFGLAALTADPSNEILAGHVVQAARFDLNIQDPLAVVPEGLRRSAAVEIAAVEFLRQRDRKEWRDAGRAVALAWPEEPHAIQFGAEAELEEILSTDAFQKTRLLDHDQRARVEKSASVLRALWNKNRLRKPQGNAEAAGQCANLLVALHGLDDLKEALAVAKDGIAFAPEVMSLRRYAAVIAVEAGDEALGAELIPSLSDEPEDVAIAFRFYANRRDWVQLAALHASATAALPPSEVAMADTLGRLANLKISSGDLEQGVTKVLDESGDDPRAAIVVADFAMDEGLPEIAEAAFVKATGLIGDDSHIARRQMVAGMALRRGDWNTVANMLDGHIDQTRDSGEMRLLATALVNESPVKQRGLRFFQGLSPELAEIEHYRRATGLFHFNRGALKQAESALRKTVAESDDILSYLALFETLRRLRRAKEIRPIIDQVDVRALRGSAAEKMAFAQAWRDAGRADQAIAFAYEVLTGSPDDAKAALGYFGLVMLDPRDKIIPWPKIVDVDTWVRLEGDLGERTELLIVAEGARPAASIVTPSHPLASRALGLGVGGTFVVTNAVTGDHEWRVAEIKHKYLHALHDVMENFETRFPDQKGIWRARMRDGDIQPALDMIKRAGEADRAGADLYLLQGFPLHMVAARVTGSVMGFADYLRAIGQEIATTLGDQQGRDLAVERIRTRRAAGAVLDTYAAWTAASMGALDTLTAVFGSLAIAQSTADELEQVREKVRPSGGRTMTIGWYEGQFIRQNLSRKDAKAQAAQVGIWIDDILGRCEILPTVAPDDLNELGVAVLDLFGPHALDAAFAAGADRILISEDQHYRGLAEGCLRVASVWLQPVFNFARDEALITPAVHAEHLVRLAWRRHGHVAGDIVSMFESLKADETTDLRDFSQVCRYLGGPRAEMKSHVKVSVNFLNLIWSDTALSRLKVMKATGIVLAAMIKVPSRDWALTLALMRVGMSSDGALYVTQWINGHFLSQAEFRKAEAQVLEFMSSSPVRVGRRRALPGL